MSTAAKRKGPVPLEHHDVAFLRDLKLLADHNGAREGETEELGQLFERACTERGLEPKTMALTVEALC